MRKTVNIYCPTYYRFDKVKASIKSIKKSIDISKHDVILFVVDNNSPKEVKDWLKDQSSANVAIRLLGENIGKGDAINGIHKSVRKADYIISIDSDIVNDKNLNWIDMFVEIMEADNTLGLVACAFSKDGLQIHHKHELTKNKKVLGNKYNISYGNRGVAGCALIMHYKDFDKVGGYNNKDIYTGHDGRLVQQVVQDLKKIAGVCEEVTLKHCLPSEGVEEDYQKWKSSKAKRKIKHDKTPNSGFYENK